MDLAFSLALFATLAIVGASYAARAALRGALRYDRVAKDQGSALLGQGPMNIGYWALTPIGTACARVGISANAITWSSLALGGAAATAFAFGHFGVGAVLAAACASCDALDGMVARQTGTASEAGEVLDAAVDRVVEFLFLAGIAVAYRASAARLVLVLLALLGSFMVSYATAKAEALQVRAPRGSMRRSERAVYLLAGVALMPVAAMVQERLALPAGAADLPVLAALALIAVVGNASAAHRLARIAVLVRTRSIPRAPIPPNETAPFPGRALEAFKARHETATMGPARDRVSRPT